MIDFKFLTLALIINLLLAGEVFTATVSTPFKEKREIDSKGYAFVGTRDEIVARAKKEGKLRVIASMEPANIRATIAAFTKKYPFIDVYVQETRGTEGAQRLVLEIQTGAAKEWDAVVVYPDFRSGYTGHIWNVDLLGMAEHGVIKIPSLMIDQKYRNVFSAHTHFQPTAYNSKVVAPHLVPKNWEDLLRPELKGRKFSVDIRPKDLAALVPAWGLEKTLDFARKIAAQQPIWVRGSRALSYLTTGEIPIVVGPNFSTVKRAQVKDRAGVLQYVILEPVPVRFGNAQAILATSQNRHAALLWLEWLASPEAQNIVDEQEPFASSVHVPGGMVERELRGKKLSMVDWENYHDVERSEAKIVEAYGFPKAEAAK